MIWPTTQWLGTLDKVLDDEDDNNLTLTQWMAGTLIQAVWPYYMLSMAFLSFHFPTCNVGMITVPTSQEGCLSSSQHRAWHMVLNPYYLL